METALSELGKADDLVSLAVPCLSNDFEETGSRGTQKKFVGYYVVFFD